MKKEISQLKPKRIWRNFEALNAVPRASKKEEQVIQFMMDFGQQLGLPTKKDAVGNVIITKPASPGMEARQTVVLQSHLDMVHQKNKDTQFDFNTQGIDMYVEDGWVKARGTTLGADNGIGVATIMAILASDDIPHPALEALFTIDEETGMTGAQGLVGGLLEGTILLNFDTEEDDEIDIGCAGGVDITATRSYQEEAVPEHTVAYQLSVNGLQGGHSGMDIHKDLGNANKIMNRMMLDGFTDFGMRIASIDGGGLRNAIPRESTAIVVVDTAHAQAFETEWQQKAQEIQTEYATVEPHLSIRAQATHMPASVVELGLQEGLIKSIYTAHNGVWSMSYAMQNLVETSNNIAKVTVGDGQIRILCLCRSSVESRKMDCANALRSAFELIGCEVAFSGSYPGWNPNPDSAILKVLQQKYVQLYNSQPRVVACHAGLECGILGQNYPNMDMISFGPNIRGAHSPDEKVEIKSVAKFWEYTKAILRDIPKRTE
ncbi:MAG: aminoacyl-histidine dipeptidase [Flavobacteriaceae bacterium]|nr:aminoacyl-histidine dipeptidase [Flavobacteriaceae bacterium]